MIRGEFDAGLSTHKRNMAISSIEQHFLEALMLGELVPESHFHLRRESA